MAQIRYEVLQTLKANNIVMRFFYKVFQETSKDMKN